MGVSPKWVKSRRRRKKKRRERKRERLNNGDNNGQATHMVHASTHGARKPPGPKSGPFLPDKFVIFEIMYSADISYFQGIYKFVISDALC